MEDKSKFHSRLVEKYKGYEIMRTVHGTGGYSDYYYISKNGERESQMCLTSPLAAHNIIDTHTRNIAQNQKPIYK